MRIILLGILMLAASRAILLGDERYWGIGVDVMRALYPTGLMISYVYPKSPAADAGLRYDLHLLSVNGIPTTEMTDEEGKNAVRGNAGTTMDIVIFDPVSEQTNRVILTNELIEVKMFPRPGTVEKFPYGTYPGKVVKVHGDVSFTRRACISITTNHVLRVVTTNGAIAWIQPTGYTITGSKTNISTETFSYSWRYGASGVAPLVHGTNTASLAHASKQVRAGRYSGAVTSNYEDGLIKATDDVRLNFGGVDDYRRLITVTYNPWDYQVEGLELNSGDEDRK